MAETITVEITPQDIIMLPKAKLQSQTFHAGETFVLLDLGDTWLLCPRTAAVDVIADYIAEGLQASGETLESVLSDIREQRASYEPDA